jgi:uroporphyrinogen-III decarboxylase
MLDLIKDRKEFLVAPGCDLTPETPFENIGSFVQTVKNHESK